MAYINAPADAAATATAPSLAHDHRAKLYYQAATHRLDQARHRQFASAHAPLQAAKAHKEADCLRAATANAAADDVVVNDNDAAGADESETQAQAHADQASGM